MTEATAAKETARIDPEEPRKTLAEWYAMFEENGGDLVADSAIERLKGGNMTAANKTTETETKFDTSAQSYSRAEMLHALANDEVDHDRAVATAAELEHLITWMRARGFDAGVAPIPALRTVGEALGTDGSAYNAGRAEGRADLCAALRAVLDPDDTRHWNQDGLLGEVRRLVSLTKAPVATADPVERPAHYTQGDVECIDAIKAQLSPDEYRGFLRGQVAKYGWRLGRKGSALEDAQKARWYLARLVRELGGGK